MSKPLWAHVLFARHHELAHRALEKQYLPEHWRACCPHKQVCGCDKGSLDILYVTFSIQFLKLGKRAGKHPGFITSQPSDLSLSHSAKWYWVIVSLETCKTVRGKEQFAPGIHSLACVSKGHTWIEIKVLAFFTHSLET